MTKNVRMTIGVIAVAALVWGFRDLVPLSNHDEPIVVDNGPIRITRESATPIDEDGEKKKWEIHHSDPLTFMTTWSYFSLSGWAKGPVVSLSGVRNITFDTFDPKDASQKSDFFLRRDQFWEIKYPQKVRLRSKFDFKYEDRAMKPDNSTYEAYRITSVTAGDTTICFREAMQPGPPQSGDCKNTITPDAIRINVCVTELKCPAPPTPGDIPKPSSDGK
jgi:hypothetical protein